MTEIKENKIFVLNEKNYVLYNSKAHDILNIHFKEFSNLYLNTNEGINFIKKHNNPDTKILFYFHNLTDFGIKILEFIKTAIIRCELVIFTFDWWIRTPTYHKKFITTVFKADRYKVVTFANNINQLNEFHGVDYKLYLDNIIFINLWCCYNTSICTFNKKPIDKILLSGSISNAYPQRRKIKHLQNVCLYKYNNIDINEKNIKGTNNYSSVLNRYLCCFTSSVTVTNVSGNSGNTHMILLKVFEILASGSLLIYPLSEKKYIKKLGLFHNINCYLIDFSKNLQIQIDEILDPANRKKIDTIRHNGFEHAIKNLNSNIKFKELKKQLNL